MSWLANCVYLVAGLLYVPVLLYQMLFQSKNRRGWGQRFGDVPWRHGDRPCIWVHGVSLGEINASPLLVAGLREARPGFDIVVSSTTDTGYSRARELYPDLTIFRFPLDFSWVVRRVLRRIRPTMIVLMELEVWYNLVTIADQEEVLVTVANGRFTERSSRRLGLVAPLVRPMFESLGWVGAQTRDVADRFERLGTDRDLIEVVGSMKWDTATVEDRVEGADVLAASMGIDGKRPLIVLGSSGPGEERQMLEAWRQLNGETDSVLVVVPRKPERFEEVARLLQRGGGGVLRRSQVLDGERPGEPSSECRLILGDTMGELRKFYSLAEVVVVGRSMVPMGGSDPMEAAALGKPIVMGPHAQNFAEPVQRLVDEGALVIVHTIEELRGQLSRLLTDAEVRRTMGRSGRAVVQSSQGATTQTVEQLLMMLPE